MLRNVIKDKSMKDKKKEREVNALRSQSAGTTEKKNVKNDPVIDGMYKFSCSNGICDHT